MQSWEYSLDQLAPDSYRDGSWQLIVPDGNLGDNPELSPDSYRDVNPKFSIKMIYREASVQDIPAIQIVRNAVKENRLSNPSVVTDRDCEEWITVRGKGWVCEIEGRIVGFAIADLIDHNIWALFVHPDFEKTGIGKRLQDLMLDWYFSQTRETVWLSTAPGTRAENFYRKSGWIDKGLRSNGEIRFELSYDDWCGKTKNQ